MGFRVPFLRHREEANHEYDQQNNRPAKIRVIDIDVEDEAGPDRPLHSIQRVSLIKGYTQLSLPSPPLLFALFKTSCQSEARHVIHNLKADDFSLHRFLFTHMIMLNSMGAVILC